jgi:hypothetical protein
VRERVLAARNRAASWNQAASQARAQRQLLAIEQHGADPAKRDQ